MFLNGLPFVVLLLAPCAPCDEQAHHGRAAHHRWNDRAVITEFTRGVDRYMNLRWMLEAPLGPDTLCADPEETQRAHEFLASAIRSERTAARAGDIFTPAVASFFRRQIGAAVRKHGHEIRTSLEEPTTGIPIDAPAVEVNGTLLWSAGDQLWPSLTATLPALPAELEYRLVGRDLVLLDVAINLVVDVLENVESTLTQPVSQYEPRHCPDCNVMPDRRGDTPPSAPGCCTNMMRNAR
jgi:hypothetical protein